MSHNLCAIKRIFRSNGKLAKKMHCSDKQNKGVVLHMKKKKKKKKKNQHPICSVLLNIYCLTIEEFPLALINVI